MCGVREEFERNNDGISHMAMFAVWMRVWGMGFGGCNLNLVL